MHEVRLQERGLVIPFLTLIAAAGACGHHPPGAGQPPPGAPAPTSASVQEFLEGLPRCRAPPAAVSPHVVREEPIGTKVSAQGVMVHNPKWECPDKRCAQPPAGGVARAPVACCGSCVTPWMIVDAKEAARPYMSRARLYLRQRGASELLSLKARDCDVPTVNALPTRTVMVSGVFGGPARRGGGSYLIEDAELCAL